MSPSQPLMSVLVTTYNHEKYIREAITSALRQTVEDIEVVIVDDGSTDRTAEVIRSFADPRVRYIRQPNQGSSAAANTALAACRGTYVAMLSGDDVLHPERLHRQPRAHERGPTRGGETARGRRPARTAFAGGDMRPAHDGPDAAAGHDRAAHPPAPGATARGPRPDPPIALVELADHLPGKRRRG